MNLLLLDTHVFLWWRSQPPKISPDVTRAIASAEVVFVSAASAWEASIKAALGKLKLPESFESGVAKSGFQQLPVGFGHAGRVSDLPPHHQDPFDRMLIAQAQSEGLTLVSHDRRLAPYDVPILWV